jgi:hypothetical protein
VRDDAFTLITFIYQNCEDDANTFCSHFKNLRPVQLKELKEQLQVTKKNEDCDFLVKLFEKVAAVEKDVS